MMNRNDEVKDLVNEYAAKELDACSKIFERNVTKVENGDQVSILDFYPEFDLKQPYTSKRFDHFSRLQRVPVWALLPYYANVIVHIHPFLSEEWFKKIYGVNIDQLLSLRDDGKVSLVLEAPYNYIENISDYMSPLYEEGVCGRIPTFSRIGAFIYFVGGQIYEDAFKEGWDLFDNKLDHLIASLCKSYNINLRGQIQNDFVENARLNYANLKGLGFREITDNIKILAASNPVSAYCRLSVYSQFLVKPKIGSFDGIHLVDRKEIPSNNFCKELGLDLSTIGTKCEPYPAEVGMSLINKAKLVVPNTLDNSLDVYSDFEKARNVLKELETVVEERIDTSEKKELILEKKTALENVWLELESINSNAKDIKKILVTLGIIDGAATSVFLDGFPGILAGLFGIVSTDYIAEPLSEKIAKFGKSSHIVEIFDFLKDRYKT